MCCGYSVDIENPLWFLFTESVGQRKADAEIEKPIFGKRSSIPLPFLSSLFTSKWWLQQLTSCEIARTLTHTHLWSHLAVTHTHRADSGDWAISSSPDESFNLSVPFEDRNKLFLGLPHQDEMAIGEIMSMTQFECLRKKRAKYFQSSLLEFLTRRLKRKSTKLDSCSDFRSTGEGWTEILSCLHMGCHCSRVTWRLKERGLPALNKFLMNAYCFHNGSPGIGISRRCTRNCQRQQTEGF